MNFYPFFRNRKKSAFGSCLALTFSFGLSFGQISVSQADEIANVKESFDLLQQALVGKNAPQALGLLTSDTRDYYRLLGRVAKSGSANEVEKLSPLNRIMVDTVRKSMPKDFFKLNKAESLLALAISKGFGSKQFTDGIRLGDVTVEGNRAFAEIFKGDKLLPIQLAFQRESGKWKVSLLSLIEQTNQLTELMMNRFNLSTEQFAALMDRVKGKKVRGSDGTLAGSIGR